jgi:hypothetical protein
MRTPLQRDRQLGAADQEHRDQLQRRRLAGLAAGEGDAGRGHDEVARDPDQGHPPPASSQGQAAKQQLDQLLADVTTTVRTAKNAVAQIQRNASAADISLAVVALAAQVKSLASETKSAVSTLKGAGGSLASAFKSADSCKSLG